ncbi:MAG: tetratricopeptide repeat protein [Burkholderiales bacterium]|nr:tetratricopeptide repeat protein [Burkholderiales bacterium]
MGIRQAARSLRTRPDLRLSRRRALGELLEIVKRDRAFGDDIGRRKMIAVFDMAAGQPDLVSDFRRRLSATLY